MNGDVEISADVADRAVARAFDDWLEELAVDTSSQIARRVEGEGKLDDLTRRDGVLIGGQGRSIGVVDGAEDEVRSIVIGAPSGSEAAVAIDRM